MYTARRVLWIYLGSLCLLCSSSLYGQFSIGALLSPQFSTKEDYFPVYIIPSDGSLVIINTASVAESFGKGVVAQADVAYSTSVMFDQARKELDFNQAFSSIGLELNLRYYLGSL